MKIGQSEFEFQGANYAPAYATTSARRFDLCTSAIETKPNFYTASAFDG